MDMKEIVHTPRPEHRRLQLEPMTGWRSIESLLVALECQVIEGCGLRVTFILNGQRADFHRPHPGKEVLRYRVKDVREFLQRAGVKP